MVVRESWGVGPFWVVREDKVADKHVKKMRLSRCHGCSWGMIVVRLIDALFESGECAWCCIVTTIMLGNIPAFKRYWPIELLV